MGKAKDKWETMSVWQKRITILSFFGLLLTGSVERGMAAYSHFATNERADQIESMVMVVENMVVATNTERRIEWLEKQDVACSDEEKAADQSERRKINCKKWRKELDDKYKELEKLQT
ncbi:MAG: hypothetical protein JRE23_00270 [Deltaproteobacteria bacterium]|nr:hypothetical protein [Deltaproteobacteria bacterium]